MKKLNFKRVMSIILTLVLALSLLPASALADEEPISDAPIVETQPEAAVEPEITLSEEYPPVEEETPQEEEMPPVEEETPPEEEMPQGEEMPPVEEETPPEEPEATTDIEGHWAQEAIEELNEQEIMLGDGEGNFRPDDPITRAEFIALVIRSIRYKTLDIEEMTGYKEISEDKWYAGEMNAAVSLGVIQSHENVIIAPEENIDRETASSVLLAILYLKVHLDAGDYEVDVNEARDWASEALDRLMDSDFLSGYNPGFNSSDVITRAEAATMMVRLWNYVQNNPGAIKNFVETFGERKLAINAEAPASITLTPLDGEYTATFDVTVSGFENEDEVGNVALDITAPIGLKAVVTPGAYENGTKAYSVTLTYNRTTAFAGKTADIVVKIAGQTDVSATVPVTIIDGQAADRAIPVTQANFTVFHSYASAGDGLKRHYTQTEDITIASGNFAATSSFITRRFTGTYDGGGFTIANLTISADSTECQGLFGAIYGGTVKNLGLVDVSITGTGDSIGGVVGYNDGGTVQNCYVTGSVTGGQYVGGVVGRSTGTVQNCYSTGSVTGGQYVGGVVGYNTFGTVQNCYVTASVIGNSGYVGGVVGYNATSGTVQNCVAMNQSVTTTGYRANSIGRVSGDFTRTNNYAWSNLVPTSTGGGTWIPNKTATGKDGTDLSAATAKKQAAWGDASGSVGAKFNFTDTWVWDSGGTNAPALKNVGTAQAWPGYLVDPIADPNLGMDGSAAKAFKVYDVTTLGYVGKGTSNPANYTGWTLEKYYEQIDDIDMTGKSFTAIGNNSTNSNNSRFTGSYDGGGFTITNLTISASGSSGQGLFGFMNGGTVKNLGLVNVSNTGGSYTGGVVGNNSGGTVQNCYVTGSVTGSSYTGGVVGYNSLGTVQNCYATASITGGDVGGVVGYNGGTVQNCYATGSITGNSDYVGGVVGSNGGTVQYCYATGSVTGTGNRGHVGGVAGHSSGGGTVQNCIALNQSVTATANATGIWRVSGGNTFTNNYAWSDLVPTSTGGGTWTPNKTAIGKDGADIAETTATTQAAWGNASGSAGAKFNFTDAWVWDSGGTNAPALKNVGTAQAWPGYLVDEIDEFNLGMDGSSAEKAFKVYDVTTLGYVGKGTSNPANYIGWTPSAYYEQIDDINMTGKSFTAIGNSATNFRGSYDGGGFTITDLTISASGANYQGLFGFINGATVKNLGLVNVSITGGTYTGGLVGYNSGGTVQNCYSTGSVNGGLYTGGVVGFNGASGTVQYCYAAASVTGNKGDVGGVVGYSAGTLQNCIALNRSVTTTENIATIGRVAGQNSNGKRTNNYAWSGMTVKYNTNTDKAISAGTGANDGADLWASNAKKQAAWGDASGSVGAKFNFTDTWVWDSGGTNAPALKNVGTAQAWPEYLVDNHNLGMDGLSAAKAFKVYDVTTLGYVGKGTSNPTDYIGWTPSAYYEQIDDIDMTGKSFTAIGNSATNFSGTYDGGGFTITNLTISARGANYQGLFGYIDHGTVKNLGLVNVSITGGSNTGGVVGYSYGGTMQNCYATGSVTGGGNTGGVVGYNKGGTIQNCYVTGSVSGTTCVGGVAGANGDGTSAGTVQNCYAAVTVSSTAYYVGGVVGNNGGTVRNCVALGDSVTTTDNTQYIGRVVGYNGGTLANNYAWSGLVPTSTGGGKWTPSKTTIGKDGGDIAATQWNSASWWTTLSTTWLTTAWDTSVWNITNNSLPTLKGVGDTVVQPPHLPN